jgi:hypothetical protein
MNPDRLAELERQRAIVRDHLAWLENEIAVATGSPPPSAPPAPSPTPSASSSAPPAVPDPIAPEISRADHSADPALAAASARRGCLLSAAALLLAGFVLLAIIYFVHYRDHPLIFMPRDQPAESRK